ncbi:hypothetical protein [Actinophytocola sp.]|uniref:hypothetical protein n=1 Tax=Actinophytocola sp. TaxID=1872138 RepID=UPI003899E2A9
MCSAGEPDSALRARVSPADILCTGPGKSTDELRTLVGLAIRAIICECESFDELARIDELSALAGRRTPVLRR